MRTREWLYVRTKDLRTDFYDLVNDPLEQVNLVDDPQYETLMDDFDSRITAQMQQTGDDWDMAADFPPPDWVTHAEAKAQLEADLLPRAIIVP